MHPSTKTTKTKQAILGAVLNPALDSASEKLDLDSLLKAGVMEDYYDNGDHQRLSAKLNDEWKCVAADYSVNYKPMADRYSPLHDDQFSIDYQTLKEVGDYKVVEITQCTYEVHENQNIRVSVHAKFIFSDHAEPRENEPVDPRQNYVCVV